MDVFEDEYGFDFTDNAEWVDNEILKLEQKLGKTYFEFDPGDVDELYSNTISEYEYDGYTNSPWSRGIEVPPNDEEAMEHIFEEWNKAYISHNAHNYTGSKIFLYLSPRKEMIIRPKCTISDMFKVFFRYVAEYGETDEEREQNMNIDDFFLPDWSRVEELREKIDNGTANESEIEEYRKRMGIGVTGTILTFIAELFAGPAIAGFLGIEAGATGLTSISGLIRLGGKAVITRIKDFMKKSVMRGINRAFPVQKRLRFYKWMNKFLKAPNQYIQKIIDKLPDDARTPLQLKLDRLETGLITEESLVEVVDYLFDEFEDKIYEMIDEEVDENIEQVELNEEENNDYHIPLEEIFEKYNEIGDNATETYMNTLMDLAGNGVLFSNEEIEEDIRHMKDELFRKEIETVRINYLFEETYGGITKADYYEQGMNHDPVIYKFIPPQYRAKLDSDIINKIRKLGDNPADIEKREELIEERQNLNTYSSTIQDVRPYIIKYIGKEGTPNMSSREFSLNKARVILYLKEGDDFNGEAWDMIEDLYLDGEKKYENIVGSEIEQLYNEIKTFLLEEDEKDNEDDEDDEDDNTNHDTPPPPPSPDDGSPNITDNEEEMDDLYPINVDTEIRLENNDTVSKKFSMSNEAYQIVKSMFNGNMLKEFQNEIKNQRKPNPNATTKEDVVDQQKLRMQKVETLKKQSSNNPNSNSGVPGPNETTTKNTDQNKLVNLKSNKGNPVITVINLGEKYNPSPNNGSEQNQQTNDVPEDTQNKNEENVIGDLHDPALAITPDDF